jgi:hypothetical protein
MFINGAPVAVDRTSQIWSMPLVQKLPDGFFEAALLSSETNDFGVSSIDFYYGRERDYCISYLARNWQRKLECSEIPYDDFAGAIKTNAGSDALRWFFKQRSHIKLLRQASGDFHHFRNTTVRQILFSSLCELVHSYPRDGEDLLETAIRYAMKDEDNLVAIEATQLLVLITDDPEQLKSILPLNESPRDFVEAILRVSEEFPFRSDSVSRVVMDALRMLHWDSGCSDDVSSEITFILCELSNSESSIVGEAACTCLGYVSPRFFLKYLSSQIRAGSFEKNSELKSRFFEGLRQSEDELREIYYGSICPGELEAILDDPEYQRRELQQMGYILTPIVKAFAEHSAVPFFLDLLEELNGKGEEDETQISEYSTKQLPDIYTLPLPFDEG